MKVHRKYTRLLEKYGLNQDSMHSYSYLKSAVEKMPDEGLKSFQK